MRTNTYLRRKKKFGKSCFYLFVGVLCPLNVSYLFITGEKKTFFVGDEIHLKIRLYTHKGIKKTSGGDLVKVLIRDNKKEAFSPGRVTDNKDGTYSAVVDALWQGHAALEAQVSYTREAITALYRTKKQVVCQ